MRLWGDGDAEAGEFFGVGEWDGEGDGVGGAVVGDGDALGGSGGGCADLVEVAGGVGVAGGFDGDGDVLGEGSVGAFEGEDEVIAGDFGFGAAAVRDGGVGTEDVFDGVGEGVVVFVVGWDAGEGVGGDEGGEVVLD